MFLLASYKCPSLHLLCFVYICTDFCSKRTNAVCYDLYECSQIAEGKGGGVSWGKPTSPKNEIEKNRTWNGMLIKQNITI